MAYPTSLGAVPALAVANTLVNTIRGLFGGSSYDATHQKIVFWVGNIASDPQQAATPGTPLYTQWIGLRCWAGDQSILSTYRQLWNDPAPQGCGCEVDHGCRADAQMAVQQLEAAFPVLRAGALSTADYPSGMQAGGGAGATVPVSVGPVTVGVPVPTSTITTAQLGGVPVWVIGLVAVAGVFALGRRR